MASLTLPRRTFEVIQALKIKRNDGVVDEDTSSDGAASRVEVDGHLWDRSQTYAFPSRKLSAA